MKRSDKIKARKRIENGCNFPNLMTISKYPGGNTVYHNYQW
jgi:hypothetical protein